MVENSVTSQLTNLKKLIYYNHAWNTNTWYNIK